MWGCGRTSMPWPRRNSAGPISSQKMNGPTICRRGEGRARRTSKPPRSRARGTITVSIASQASRSPGLGSSTGCQLMGPLLRAGARRALLLRVERRRAGRLAVRADRDLLDAGLGALQERLAVLLQELAALVDGNRVLEGHVALLEPLHDALELLQRLLEGQVRELGRGLRRRVGIRVHGRLMGTRRGAGKGGRSAQPDGSGRGAARTRSFW